MVVVVEAVGGSVVVVQVVGERIVIVGSRWEGSSCKFSCCSCSSC